jgi:hypothetical protein
MLEGPRTEEAGPAVDPAGAPVEDAGLGEDVMEGTRPASGRVLDRGAIYAAMVGLGMAVTIAISFALVVAVQSLVFISAPIAGAIIGFYANHKSERWRPRGRLFVNAGFAGLVTGLSLALIYLGIRLLFIYADSGYRPEPLGGQLECAMGPDCYYARLIEEGEGESLAAEGISDAASLEQAVWMQLGEWLLILTGLTLGGSFVAAGWRAVRTPPAAATQELVEGPTPAT